MKEKFEKIKNWWEGKNRKPLIQISILKDKNFINLNNLWKRENEKVDFEKFVLYELEKLKDYLEYMVWHLDGPDEIKHLDILLSLPYIKAIQVVPGAGRPPCTSSLWLPNIEKILILKIKLKKIY